MTGVATGPWWVALAAGAVVIVATVVLLRRFVAQVHRIEEGVHAIWNAGTSVARNTSTTWLLTETASRLDAVIEATGAHRRHLGDGSPER